jgi:hypothetical protein
MPKQFKIRHCQIQTGPPPSAKKNPPAEIGGLSNHGTGQGPQFLNVAHTALGFILRTAKIIVKNPPGGPAPCFFTQQKAATAMQGWSGDGFSQYETTDMSPSTWPRPKTCSQAKNRRWGLGHTDGLST